MPDIGARLQVKPVLDVKTHGINKPNTNIRPSTRIAQNIPMTSE